jgi:hypothetical protein
MTSRDFCYWLQGFFELTGSNKALTKEQCQMIKAHLAMVFVHEIDPSHGTPEHRAVLQDLHDDKDTEKDVNADSIKGLKKLLEERQQSGQSCSHDVKFMC